MIAAVTPVAVGTAWAGAAYHRFDGAEFGLAIAVMVLAHAGADVYNDVGDDITGADPGNVEHIYPYTGGCTLHISRTSIAHADDTPRIRFGRHRAAARCVARGGAWPGA